MDVEEFLHIDDHLQVDGVSIIKSNDDEPKMDPIEESPKISNETKLRHKVLKSHINSLKQTTLDHFIQIV
ncbi:unnamed protein product [Rhizophagus irregularis]|nr:unnamed protein product [Rhizophagus irregularis]